MTNFVFYANPVLTVACLTADTPRFFSLHEAARLCGVHSDLLLYYCRTGLIEGRRDETDNGICFDENALQEVRRIQHYRQHLGVGRRALPLVCELRREGERQQIELHFLRIP